jgi:hypothetical protein
MFRVGPYPELLGTSPTTLAALPHTRDDVRFDDATSFANVRPSSGYVPATIAGAISGDPLPEGAPLAIAVGGRVRAMTRSYELDGQTRFTALVPETAFHNGGNTVEIYAVSRSSDAIRLTRLGGTPANGTSTPVAASAVETGARRGHRRR